MSDYIHTRIIHFADEIETMPKGQLVKLLSHLVEKFGMSLLYEVDIFFNRDTESK